MNLYFIKRFKVTNNIDNKINRERNEKKIFILIVLMWF